MLTEHLEARTELQWDVVSQSSNNKDNKISLWMITLLNINDNQHCAFTGVGTETHVQLTLGQLQTTVTGNIGPTTNHSHWQHYNSLHNLITNEVASRLSLVQVPQLNAGTSPMGSPHHVHPDLDVTDQSTVLITEWRMEVQGTQWSCAGTRDTVVVCRCKGHSGRVQVQGTQLSCAGARDTVVVCRCKGHSGRVQVQGTQWSCAGARDTVVVCRCKGHSGLVQVQGTRWSCGTPPTSGGG